MGLAKANARQATNTKPSHIIKVITTLVGNSVFLRLLDDLYGLYRLIFSSFLYEAVGQVLPRQCAFVFLLLGLNGTDLLIGSSVVTIQV